MRVLIRYMQKGYNMKVRDVYPVKNAKLRPLKVSILIEHQMKLEPTPNLQQLQDEDFAR